MCIILPRSIIYKGGIGRVQKRLVDDSDDGDVIKNEADRDAEHGEEVCVVYCSVQGVDDPCWRVVY
jgi:hypothetical protein